MALLSACTAVLSCGLKIYDRLGLNEMMRQQAFASLFDIVADKKEIQTIRNAVKFSMPTGDSRFQRQIKQVLKRKLGYAYRGRPRKSSKTGCK